MRASEVEPARALDRTKNGRMIDKDRGLRCRKQTKTCAQWVPGVVEGQAWRMSAGATALYSTSLVNEEKA